MGDYDEKTGLCTCGEEVHPGYPCEEIKRMKESKAMSNKFKKDRFTLEENIMSAWSTTDDIQLFLEKYIDGETPMTEDDIANYMIGLKEIHDARCERLFNTFETLIHSKQL